jgi:anti-anti-sigma factor
LTFTHRIRVAGASIVVALDGELDVNVSDSVETMVQRLIAQRHPAVLHIDLSDLRFLDSTGVSVLVRLWRLARRERCTLRVVNAAGTVRHILEVTGALTILGGAPAPEVTPGSTR